MKTWKIELELKVADAWIADGFNPSDPKTLERIEEILQDLLPYADYQIELKTKARLLTAPSEKEINKIRNR